MFLGPQDVQYGKKAALSPNLLAPCTKVKSRWIMDLNTKDKTTKLLEGNVRDLLLKLEIGFIGRFLRQDLESNGHQKHK